MNALHGHAAMLLFAFLVAGSFSLGGLIARMVDPTVLTLVRFILAAAVLGGIAAVTGRIKAWHLRASWRYPLLGGIFAIYFILMFVGLRTASAINTAAMFTLTPILSAGFGYVLLGQRTTPRMAAALMLGGAGALWVIFDASPERLLAFDIGTGEAIFFLGVVAHALYTPLVRKLNRGEPPLVFTLGMLLGAIVLMALYAGGDALATDWTVLPPIFWLVLAYLSIFASATTFLLLQFATLRLPSSKVMAYTYLTPAVVIVWEGALGNGWPQPVLAVGVMATILALLMLLRDEG
ncbi:DMT family transporter [Pontivivens nitratireducens]|uniref:DMT family transporter n=1 Tax=Pontivivens nitratireducens TaxID=2758038 RepID=UPI00163AFC52|nr:DMT family transporter [Pontibrevibacter nitratireducens]